MSVKVSIPLPPCSVPKPLKVEFSPTALFDLEDVADYIAAGATIVPTTPSPLIGQTALVTGSTTGFGRATANVFA